MLVSEVWVEGYCVDDDDEMIDDPYVMGKHASGRPVAWEESFEEGFAGEDGEPKKRGVRNKQLGRYGEAAAARYLEYMGLDILERNWESPFGEADIIARDGDTLVFVEVKTRRSIKKGFPSEAVTPKKRDRYEKIAMCYLSDYNYTDIPVRFDVVAIMVLGDDRAMIKHYVNAFGWER